MAQRITYSQLKAGLFQWQRWLPKRGLVAFGTVSRLDPRGQPWRVRMVYPTGRQERRTGASREAAVKALLLSVGMK